VGGKGGNNATRARIGKTRPDAARRRLIDEIYADDPHAAPDWLDAALLSTGDVALIFRVTRRAVTGWAHAGKLAYLTTPGGHRRYRAGDVRTLLETAESRAIVRRR